jgi:hypothetical protein
MDPGQPVGFVEHRDSEAGVVRLLNGVRGAGAKSRLQASGDIVMFTPPAAPWPLGSLSLNDIQA